MINRGRPKVIREDGPTPETAKKHLDRARVFHIPEGKEAGYAESTIGVLEARGMISVEQAELCKKLATLRSVLYGSGHARCSSVENVGRGLPNDKETKHMRETWTAYKAVMATIHKGELDLFEHVILRNNYREWMRLPDTNVIWNDRVPVGEHGIIGQGDNQWRDGGGYHDVYGKLREVRILLQVIRLLGERMTREMKAGSLTGYTAMSEAQRNALDGDSRLCELYAHKGES